MVNCRFNPELREPKNFERWLDKAKGGSKVRNGIAVAGICTVVAFGLWWMRRKRPKNVPVRGVQVLQYTCVTVYGFRLAVSHFRTDTPCDSKSICLTAAL